MSACTSRIDVRWCVVIWLALIAGACASAAALYGHYLVLPGWLTGPEICQLEHGGCQVLFRTPAPACSASRTPRSASCSM